MSSEFKKAKLVDLCELISRGITPSYTEDIEEGVVVLNQKCIRDNRINFDLARLTNSNKKKVTENKYLRKYDILVNSTGVGTLGRVAQVKKLDKKMTVDSHVTIVRPKAEIDPIYLGYYMFMKQKYIEYLGEGSTGQTELSRVRLGEALEVNFPSLEEQKAIAKVLSDLDEKIETNNKINKKLEEMAQAIFKQWFVDFEFPNEYGKPYKSSSGEMVESELGMIPKGWEVILLDEIVDTFNGYSYKGKELSESEDAMITIKNFDRNGGYKMDGLKEIVISDKVKPHHFVEVNDIIVAHTDLTQGAEIIGNPIMIFSKGSYEKLIMSMDTVKVKSKIKEMNNELLYFILKDYRFKQYALGYVNGTTVLHLSKSTIPQYKIALPYDKSIMNQLGNNLSPIMSKIANNFKENEKLIMLRDTLLPKLMSGEIRVPID
ncbi:restriction endonuclease subunit S [Clostridium sp. ETTB3]